MASAGQRFELDLDSDNFAINLNDDDNNLPGFAVKAIQEHGDSVPPSPPSLKTSRSGFPTHNIRLRPSRFKQRQQTGTSGAQLQSIKPVEGPSDGGNRGTPQQHEHGTNRQVDDVEAREKAEISKENDKRLAEMSEEEIAAARAELLGGLSPDLVERLLKRANIGHDPSLETSDQEHTPYPLSDSQLPSSSTLHFPTPNDPSAYTALDPNSPSFLTDLHSTYFPSLPHNPSSLSWMTDPTEADDQHSPYNPSLASLPASALRFSFTGRLIPPNESLTIPVTEGLHHHGQAPSSAGYTIPELTLLARSTMPNQRCVAYQTIGRILYRLGKGEFGPSGTELEDAIWDVVERERILELVLAEAGKNSGHLSARKYATDALWLWRRGRAEGAPERGIRKPVHESGMRSIQEEVRIERGGESS
ncbi:hypothetical protein DV737_g775, partial [Chaetothyriales sp. CBS 132003]